MTEDEEQKLINNIDNLTREIASALYKNTDLGFVDSHYFVKMSRRFLTSNFLIAQSYLEEGFFYNEAVVQT